jgi:hypothetical protein
MLTAYTDLPLLRIALRHLVRASPHHVPATEGANVGLDYDRAGERYRAHADGDVEKLYEFHGQYAYGDREVWRIVANTLKEMQARGDRKLSVLDLGCGPGTWIWRVVGRAWQLGLTQICARGVDLAKAQVRRSRLLSRDLAGMPL